MAQVIGARVHASSGGCPSLSVARSHGGHLKVHKPNSASSAWVSHTGSGRSFRKIGRREGPWAFTSLNGVVVRVAAMEHQTKFRWTIPTHGTNFRWDTVWPYHRQSA